MPLLSCVSRFFGRAIPNRAHTGLLGKAQIKYGDKLSKSGNRSRRTWKPNVYELKLYSIILAGRLKLKVSEEVLREIDAKGGLDAYLLTTPDTKIFSEMGIELKNQLITRLHKNNSQNSTSSVLEIEQE
ncbi:hypothetical protein HMI54_002608 [Coelomomyces lativittatus]|nr:hypothetical protein HMI56_001356 [Coelomomyces lativittatus]KAJ1509131.1 hypothetical protein HMI54_002608 [Coelomomyces lativittatus]KAJ1518069.1 hypothetical protein HMI55_003422 [Coelomomyces lativittatus]